MKARPQSNSYPLGMRRVVYLFSLLNTDHWDFEK